MKLVDVRTKLAREGAAAGLVATGRPGAVVTDDDLAPLPAPAQRYLRFMGVVGRPRDTSFGAHLRGRFRMAPGAAWKPLDAWQLSSGAPDVARLFYMALPFFRLPVLGRDTYVRGQGRLLVRALDLVTVQDARGAELDLGELVTWLNDAVLLAPSMLLDAAVTWRAAEGEGAFDLALADRGHTVTARVFVDARGAPTDFRTDDRWFTPPGGKPVRTTWSTPVAGWQEVGGRMLPAEGRATWKRPEGDFTYVDVDFAAAQIAYGVAPGWPNARE